jgi:hypothetical protein
MIQIIAKTMKILEINYIRKLLPYLALLLFSCVQKSNESDFDNHKMDTQKVEFTYKDNELVSQHLISKGDTLHTIIYENGKIIFNESVYISTIIWMLPQTKEIVFEVSTVEIDTLEKVFFIRKFNNETGQYKPLFSEQLDSVYSKIIYQFDVEEIEIIAGVIYGDRSGALFTKYIAPIKLDFNKNFFEPSGRLDSLIVP